MTVESIYEWIFRVVTLSGVIVTMWVAIRSDRRSKAAQIELHVQMNGRLTEFRKELRDSGALREDAAFKAGELKANDEQRAAAAHKGETG